MNKIRIKLKSYDHSLLDKSTQRIVKTAKDTGALILGPIPLPSKKTIITVNRSVFVDKLSNGKVVVVENFIIDSFKTRSLNGILKLLKIEKSKISLLVEKSNENLNRAVRNLANIYMVKASNVSVYELLDCDVILVDLESFNLLVGMLEK